MFERFYWVGVLNQMKYRFDKTRFYCFMLQVERLFASSARAEDAVVTSATEEEIVSAPMPGQL